MSLRRSYTAVVERNVEWSDTFSTEPYEAAWASEALFFIRALEITGQVSSQAKVQISPDGIHWVDESTSIDLPTKKDNVAFCKVQHFGGWLRLHGNLSNEEKLTVIVYLVLKE